MNKIDFITINSRSELERSYLVLKELRNNLTYENFICLYNEAHLNGYILVGLESDGMLCALMGYRILVDFVHGRHLYIDDLVCAETYRSKGLGAKLLQHAEVLAKENHCQGMRLCTGIENELAKKFYEREGWTLRAVAFKKKL